ncbi:MAG TPA: tetraacyldisaccharide 4'-kinase [candidate division Zixibacteria bacterium]
MWFLSFLSQLYGFALSIRSLLYRSGIFRPSKLKVKVISVGNVTAGGTGKTPLVIYLAEKLKEKKKRVVILTRGYKRKSKNMVDLNREDKEEISWEDVGDEPFLISRRLGGVPVIVTKHRVISGSYAVERYDPDVLILDDGFQHLKLQRDLDMVVIDSTNPWGNGRLLPAGLLREPLSSLRRADIFILTKTNQVSDLAETINTLRQYNTQAPMVESIYRISSVENLSDNLPVDTEKLENKKVLAFSGIGNPMSFENSLRQLKINVLKHRMFADHFAYRRKDVLSLLEEAKNLGADFIVTTEKDSVRIPLVNRQEMPIYVFKIDLKITGGEEMLFEKIEGMI